MSRVLAVGAMFLASCAAPSAYRRAMELADADTSAAIGALKDEDWKVSATASRVLRGRQETSAAAALVETMTGHHAWQARAYAANALGTCSTPNVVPALISTANIDNSPAVREEAVGALGEMRNLSVAVALVRLTQDSEAAIRQRATEALSRLQAARGVSPEDQKQAALLTLGREGDAAAALRFWSTLVANDRQEPPAAIRAEIDRLTLIERRRKRQVELAEKQRQEALRTLRLDEARVAIQSRDFEVAANRLNEARTLGEVPADLDADVEAGLAAEKRARAEFENLWGPFSSWRGKPSNRRAVSTLRRLFLQDKALTKLISQHVEAKQSNDSEVREPSQVSTPVFPEISGAFMFIKILDRSAGEALFEASDGLFVLRLSFGDSFNAYPGQNVRMTIHTRGETVLMTTGSRLPVFMSGNSPVRTRRIPGFTPSRKKERQLESRINALKAVVARERTNSFRFDTETESWRMTGTPSRVQVNVFFEGDGPVRCLIRDPEYPVVPYCIATSTVTCPSVKEKVSVDDLLATD